MSFSDREETFNVREFISWLEATSRDEKTVTRIEHIPARPVKYGAYEELLSPNVENALRSRGVEKPWSHQSDAWKILASGKDLVVVTPTASGKTLCYQAPIVSMLSEAEEGSALLLYPTKALSQDQCAALNALLEESGLPDRSHVYDGDTPGDIRKRIRESSRLVLTNPDMLHSAILPHHDKWRRLFATLKFVVIDEAHMYRGVFGSHFANVIRRLRRICAYYGSDPQFVFTSATIANPVDLAERLAGRRPEAVMESGAPTGEKWFVFYNPPMKNLEQMLRQSSNSASRRIAQKALTSGASAIVFSRSRIGVEVMTRMLREKLVDAGRARLAKKVEGYRAGYLPLERRRIERDLREGNVRAVITTNALELGVDIGALDVCILSGYPGTIASSWQQAGRAGRRQQAALMILVASDEPVDQYIVNHPDFFLGSSPEYALIDPDNLRILVEHLKCAIFELPLGTDQGFGDLDVQTTQEVVDWLSEGTNFLTQYRGKWRWSSDNYPATTVNIRDALNENFVIINTDGPREDIIGEIDFDSAHKTVYEKAIYQHAGQLYEVQRLDYDDRKAWIEPVNSDYFTTAIEQARVFVLDEFEREAFPSITLAWGEVRVARRFVGYKKVRFKTGENVGYGEILLPDIEKHTSAWWMEFPREVIRALDFDESLLGASLSGAETSLRTCAVVRAMCDGRDIGSVVGSADGQAWLTQEDRELEAALRGSEAEDESVDDPIAVNGVGAPPAIFLYDQYPGGIGLAEKLFGLGLGLIEDAISLVSRCECSIGCPACVGAGALLLGRERTKDATLTLLRAVVSSLATENPA